MPALLQLNSITKSFAGVQALKDVSFELLEGEVHALVGENGAGKSTLVKVITGAHRPDSGEIRLAGDVVEMSDPNVARAMGVAAIYQQPALFGELTVAENIALRLERGRTWRWLNWKARRAKARELLEVVGASISPDAAVRSLTMPQQQLVEIAAALGSKARILILDEPTNGLDPAGINEIRMLIRSLPERRGLMISSPAICWPKWSRCNAFRHHLRRAVEIRGDGGDC